MVHLKKIILYVIIYIFLMFFIPEVVVYFLSPSPSPSPETVKTYVKAENTVREFPLEEYLVGVVGAEMPATFPVEALKAQAVAARTFIVYKTAFGASDAHGGTGAPVCTDPGHCKAWKSVEELMNSWGGDNTLAEDYMNKIKTAVSETRGEIITFEGNPISAVYYSMSSGKTENSEDVWGGNVPYLKSVSSSFDEKAPGFNSEAAFTIEEFKKVILSENPLATFDNDPAFWITNIVRSEGGGVVSLEIGGAKFKGTRIRTLFSLRSHNFTIEFNNGIALFRVKGYGHGVGMSQWGSKFLAEEGKSYDEIIKYYYSGVEIEKT